MPYPEERALEDVAYGQGLVPARIFGMMLPVHQVEVKATTTDGRPYELIDRFLERGIGTAGLSTVADLARFFALDKALVDRAVRFLMAIEHVTVQHDRLVLTELGQRSLRDDVCYLVTREDRRKMYFDGFGSRPLSRRYYDPGVVTMLTVPEIPETGQRFLMLLCTNGFRREALAELAGNPDRDHYNLPARIDKPESLSEKLVHLPVYVVRAIDSRGRVRHLAYSQAADTADPEISEICERTPEIAEVLNNEELAAAARSETPAIGWLRNRKLEHHRPRRAEHGTWRVTLSAGDFEPGPVSLSKLGSFVVMGTDLLHVWCDDKKTRERALLERADALSARGGPRDVADRIARIAHQLRLHTDLPALRRMAAAAGRKGLVARLAELTKDG